ncbi:hypothetical protein P7D52_05755 [Enterococcus dongliensis]|uniref:Uncharacterized protein n=1 Tax=Enterococcus dongliensis TaxID=2559925 RepID=A0AAP5KUW1_9ENTE|nr:hypothetical protein [Enterococcus dongliensis]MDT2596414.1 hypothetical protein [Enterococcus dongliensis]MDT2603740.1 hypothetical protein [Enterococcus dongliensis]MDT2634105.1 hypothetical protein [Enterococcus dongliensis]MDT2637035.1 hypothetical protein [Enterococcus dongliensis]MDT2640243.1 hypothetical protein [Enterococcus dongliensis]
MWKEVIQQKTVQNTILRNGLRLLRQKNWCHSKDKEALLEISSQLQHVMQLHLETENLVVGVPGFGKEVTLLEIDEPQFVPHYQIEQVIESAAGHFIKLKLIKTV